MKKRRIPFVLILLGLLLLFFIQPIPAGVLFLLGIVMIIENKWPEKWDSKKQNTLP